jgi:hypothetical protein
MVGRADDRLWLKMATKSAKAIKPKAGAKIAVTFQPGYDHEFFTAYSNFASISHTNNDFCLDFVFYHLVQVDTDNKIVITPVVARIIVPPRMVEGLELSRWSWKSTATKSLRPSLFQNDQQIRMSTTLRIRQQPRLNTSLWRAHSNTVSLSC